MASDIEQRNFVDKDGLEQFWDDIQLYLTRKYKELPSGMQFSRIYQENGRLHILVEPFGGSTEDRKAASRANLGVYSKAEIDANYKTKQDGVSEQFTEYQTLLDISQDTNGEISVRKQVIPTATVGTLGLTTLKGVVSADEGDDSTAATPKAVADAIAATIAGLDVSEVSIGEAKTVGTISEVDGKIVVTAVDILVGNSNIADDAVTGDKIADDSIGNEHIAVGAVHEEQILDGSVANSKIHDGAITYEKVTNTEDHPFPIDISGNAATATTVQEGGELDRRIDSIENGKADKVTGATAGNFAGLDAEGNLVDSGHKHSDYKTVQEPVSDPETSGNTDNFEFISSVEQNPNGLISATKHTIPKSNAIDSDSSVTLATSAAVKTAVEHAQSGLSALDVENHLQTGEYITTLSQTDGLITYDTEPMATEAVENGTAPVTSHALYVEKHQRETADTRFDELIPTQASANNQLADKAYVDAIGTRLEARYLSSYSEELDEYIPFPTYADFVAAQSTGDFYYNGTRVTKVDNNDVIVITADENHLNEAGGPSTTRYRYQCDVTTGQDGHWYFEYVINNTALNLAQLQAIDSGINADKVNAYDIHIASDGKEGRQANPHSVTFDQLEGRNGVTSTELGVLAGVDTRNVGSSQLNTLAGIHIEEGVTIQSQLNDKVERVSPKYSPEEDPEYTSSGKIAIIDDNADVNGRFGVEDSGAEIVANYNGNDTINPATGSAIHQAIAAIEGTHTSDASKMSITVATDQHGIIDSVTIDDSGLATAEQGAKADSAVQTVTLNGTELSGNDIDLGNLKTTQEAVTDPTSSGNTENYEFISNISQNTNGVINATKKLIPDADTNSTKGVVTLAGSIGATVSEENGKAATEKAVRDAINDLNVDNIEGFGAGQTLATLEENNGKISATFQDIAITKSQVTDFSHSHGNIANDGTIGSDSNKVLVTTTDGEIVAGDIDWVYSAGNPIATKETVRYAISNLEKNDSTETNKFVTAVSESEGIITVAKAQPTISNVDGLSDRLTGLDNAISALESNKADKVTGATNGNLAGLDANGNLTDSGYHVVDTYKVSDDKSAYLANPVTGTAVDAAISESASSDRQYVDDKINALDATETGTGTNMSVTVTEVDGKITGVSVTDNTVNATDVANKVETEINKLDSTKTGSGPNVSVTVAEVDGKIDSVTVTDNSINSTDLTEAIEGLDAEETSIDGTNVQFKVTEVDGKITAVNVTTDNTVNATDVANKVATEIGKLDAEETSIDGTNVQFKVTEVDGKITAVNVTTDNTVNATDVANKVATEIGKLDVDNITGFGADKTLKTLTETDGKIDATFQSILVDTANIKPDAVKTAQIADDAVTSDKIKEGEVKTANIADDAVTSDKIKEGEVKTANIADDAVTSGKIKEGEVKTANIADGAVTTDKLDAGAVTSEKIGEGEVKTINIDDEAVTTAKIADDAVTNYKIASNAVDTAQINAGAVTTDKIADDAVTNDKIADNAVDTAQIKDGAVATVKIADDAVTNDKIADNAVDTAQIKAGAVTYDKVTKDPENPFPIDISGNADTATHADNASHADLADIAKDVQEGSSLDQRLDTIEENISELDNTKADKVANAVSGNFAGLNANGNLTDSGVNADSFKTKQTAQTNTGSSLKTATKINQNENGELDVEISDIQSASTSQKGVVQLAGSIGTTVASENNKAASEKAVRDAIDGVVSGLDTEVTSSDGTNVQVKVTEVDGKITAVNITTDETEDKNNKVTSWSATTTDAHYPSEKLVKGSLDEKADKVDNATDGNFAGLDANGNLTDSGVNADTFKTKQTAVDESGNTLKTLTRIQQNANGEITPTFSDIQTASTSQSGVVQLAGSIGATVASENYKAASEKAVRDAIDNALENTIDSLDVEEVGGAGKYISAISETDGKISATVTDMDTAPASASTNAVTSGGVYTAINDAVNALDATVSDSSTNVSVSVTETNGKLTSITVTDTAATSDHVHGNITNDGKVGSDANKVLVTTTGGTVTAGNIDGTYNASTNKIATQSTVTNAINALDVSNISGFGADKTLATLAETDGKIAASFQSIQIAESQVTGLKDDLEDIDDALKTKEDKANKVTSWSATTTDTRYPSEKLVKDSLDTKVDKTTKVNGHALSNDVTVTKSDVGLGNVVNTGDSDTPVENGTTKFTTGGAYTELNKKADKTATVSNVAYDGTNKKITKTINGTTSDVVTAATLKADMALDNVANTNITVSATDGVTDNTNNVTYKYNHPTTTAKAAAAVKVGHDNLGHVVVGAALQKSDVGLGNVENTSITVSATDGVKDNTNNVTYKYVHPTGAQSAKTAAAVKVGVDATGHAILGTAITKSDVGLDLVQNQTITVTSTSVSDGTHTFNKYVHPTGAQSAKTAAAVKVGVDATGHAIIGAALTNSDVGLGNVTNDAQVKRSEMGVANGVATLDNDGKVPASQLPSYIDDVIEGYYDHSEFYEDAAHTVLIPHESGKVYVDKNTNLTYRWSGTAYVKIASDLALGTTHATAYYGDQGEAAYQHSLVVTGNPHHVTKADVGLGRVSNTTITVSDTDGVTSNDGTTSVTYKYTHPTTTAVAASAKKVGYDNQGHVVLGDALVKGDVGLGNVDNTSDATKKTNFTGLIASGNTGFVTGGAAYTELNKKADKTATVSTVTYDTTDKKITKTINGTTTDVVTAAKLKEDMALDLVKNQAITVTSTSVSDGTNTFNKYTHPTYTAATAAAVKVGRDSTGHVVLGTALGKSDVGLGNVDNTSDDTKKANFTGAVASGNTGFPTGGDVYTAIADGKECVVVTLDTPYSEVAAIVNAGKFPVLKYIDMYFPLTLIVGGGNTAAYWFYSTRLGDPENYHTSVTIMKYVCKNADPAWSSTSNTYLQNNSELVSSWSTTVSNSRYPSEKLVKTSLDKKVDKVDGMGLSSNDYTTEEKTKLAGIAAGAEVNQNAFSNVKVGSTTVAADSKTDTLELVAGSNVTITPDATNDKITIAAKDTTYESKAAASGGTDVSLVTTGEKYTWNSKQDALAAQTAYASKGSATKVPQITTNSLGQVTGITEVAISGVTPASHTHGNITNAGAIGTTSGQAVYTTTNGVLTAGSLATTDPDAEGNALEFIATVSQDAKGKITATKKTVSTMGAASSSAAGKAGLVPAPGSGKQGAFLRGDGTWQTPGDSKVTQNLLAATTDAEYPVILKNSTTATDSPTSTENYAAGITVNPKNKSVTATTFVGSLTGTADAAKAYDTSFTGTNSIKSALDGKAASSHAHGNITNAGALQATDVAIANGDKLVITDASNSNKVARTSTSFDGNTVSKALTPKGTFEDFAKQADIDTAIDEIPSLNLVGDNHITVTTDDDTGTVTIATDIASQTAYSAKGSATKVPQITTNALGQVTGITEVTISGVAPAAHEHGNISNTGAIGTTSGQAVYTTTDGVLTAGSLATSDPTASGNSLSFIATVSQDAKGKITATKKSVTVDSTYSSTGTNPVNGKAIAAAIGTLDVSAITGGTGKTITSISETDGKISATYSDISITKSQVSDFAHAHGNITNAGGITADAVPVASGDAIVVVDSSDTSKKVVKSSISFDGSTTTQALTKAGTWATFNNYSHPAGSAPSVTGFPAAGGTLSFGGTFDVNQVTTDSTSHVSSITKRTFTLPSLGTTETTAAKGNHTHTASIAADTGTSALAMTANTKYKLTAGGSTFIFTTPKDTTYTSKAAVSGGTDVSLVTTGEKWTWNHKQDALTEMTTTEVSDLVAAFAS